MVYNGILMETIGISVMVSFGLLLFFLAGLYQKLTISMNLKIFRVILCPCMGCHTLKHSLFATYW